MVLSLGLFFHFLILIGHLREFFLNLISWFFVLLCGSFAWPRDQNDPRNYANGHEQEVNNKIKNCEACQMENDLTIARRHLLRAAASPYVSQPLSITLCIVPLQLKARRS
ncbi:hypothetical protein BH18ACI4_BH18ACI4_11150 [soil metagenome]